MGRIKKFFSSILKSSKRDGDARTSGQSQPAVLTNVAEVSQHLAQPVSTSEAAATTSEFPTGHQGDADVEQVERGTDSIPTPLNTSLVNYSAIPAASQILDRGGEKFGLFPMNLKAKGLGMTTTQGSNTAGDSRNPLIETYPIDIVAIHGITGDAYNTWTHDNGKLWLSDFLNDDLPGARIFSYGYDASVFFSFSEGGYDQFARTLLACINQARTSEANKRRPLVFICHSMGGIIVKQAIITSILRSDLYGNIRSSCFGIMFLGTPHQGSKENGFPKIIAAITNVAMLGTSRLFGRARTELLTGLDREAPTLDKISRDFVQQTTTIKIASFIEQNITPPAKNRIVDGISGEMKVPGEEVIDMQGCDHKSICRFANQNHNYILLLNVILGWFSSMQPHENAVQDQLPVAESISSLQFRGLNWRRLQLESRELEARKHHNTCAWIFNCDPYRAWLDHPEGIFWIKGKPGAGKSTIMETLVGHFEKKPKSYIVLAFFFDAFGDPDIRLRNSAAGMYRTLLSQLLQQVPSAAFRFQEIYEKRQLFKRNEPIEWEDGEQNILRKYLMDGLEKLEKASTKIRIFVDAIDEAVQGTSDEIVRYLYDLDKRLRGNGMDVRVCISSRHFPITTVRRQHSLVMEDENSGDIDSYVEREFEIREILRRKTLDRTGVLSELKQQIKEKASGIFLWVSLIVEIVIDRLNAGDSRGQVFARMDLPPPGLGKIYADMLRNIVKKEDRSDAYSMLRWTVKTNKPLLLGRLANEVKWTYPFSHGDDEKELLERMVLCVGSYSGGLVETKYHDVPESTTMVLFIHQTVLTFLKEGGLKTFRDELLISWASDSVSSSSSADEDEGSYTSGTLPRPSSSLSRDRDSSQSSRSESTGKQTANTKPNQLQTLSLEYLVDDLQTLSPPRSSVSRKNFGAGERASERSKIYTQVYGEHLLSSKRGRNDLHRATREKFLSADQWLEKLEHTTRLFRSQAIQNGSPVKIAILDTGINPYHPWPPIDNAILKLDSFWHSGRAADEMDYQGSGTYIACLLSKIAPFAKLYIAKVVDDAPLDLVKGRSTFESTFESRTIAKAIDWAVESGVDIISMSFGFESYHDEISEVIRRAKSKNIIMFAAAGSREHSSRIAFPASSSDVINIFSADGYGNPSPFNPEPSETGENFSVLGEGVQSVWLGPSDKRDSSERLSGTSVATPIAAGIAALLLHFLRKNPSNISSEKLSRFTSPDAIKVLFRYMSSSRGTFGNILPWKLFRSHATHEEIENTIYRIISQDEHLEGPSLPPSDRRISEEVEEMPLSGAQDRGDSKAKHLYKPTNTNELALEPEGGVIT